jgi:hypothetical protein
MFEVAATACIHAFEVRAKHYFIFITASPAFDPALLFGQQFYDS